MLSQYLDKPWQQLLGDEFQQQYFLKLTQFVENEYATKPDRIYPERENIFRAFNLCPPEKLRVVILGQDPYHGDGQAHGLAFSVPDNTPKPPSLVNIFKEIHDSLGTPTPQNGNLERWAQQGVLLLNSVLTVEAHKPASHKKQGWETFTDAAIQTISQNKAGIVYILWGNYAQRKARIISSANQHHIITGVHPSPLSAYRGDGFFGKNHFGEANNYLESMGQLPIIW